MNKDLRQLIREYQRYGWTITKTGSNHYLWLSPDGREVITASTPGDYRNLANIKSQLRRNTKDRHHEQRQTRSNREAPR